MMKMSGWFLLLGFALCAGAQQPAPASNTAAAASRDLWLGDEGRYVRQWLLLGPVRAAQADEIAKPGAATQIGLPTRGTAQNFSDGSAASWRAQGSYGDILDGFSAAGMKDGEAGIALASIERANAGNARLLIGGNVLGVWVNGRWIGGTQSSPAFVIDGATYEAPFNQGTNLVLLRVERLDRPVPLTLRVVEPGFVSESATGMAPYLMEVGGALQVFPGTTSNASQPTIEYEAIAPGGRVLGTQRAGRAAAATFDATPWPEGPYEIRVRSQNALGETVIVHLPWFKGDAQAAAQRLLEAAAAPGASEQVKMLAEMARDRRDGGWRELHSPLMEFAELALERAGKVGGARNSGFVRLGWTDEIDGSTQFCRAYLPDTFEAGKPLPALLFLHGYNPANPPYVRWWSIADRHNGVAERHDLIVLEPMGRGNVDYRWMGEADVLRCLDAATQRFKIDPERVYLTGESMGGNGTWLIASRHPGVFAAAAPVFGGWDYRINVNGYNYTNPEATRPMERFLHEAHSSFAGAEGLLHVPLYVLQGDRDNAVPVEQSRHGVQLLQRWGYDVRYREIPGRGHEDLRARDEIADWLLEHRRVTEPREVRLRSYDLAGAAAHWLTVSMWQNPFEMIEARARVVDGETIRIDTKNVASIVFSPPPGMLTQRGSGKLNVVWNGRRFLSSLPKTGVYGATAPGFEGSAGDKNRAREGRLSYFFDTPFAIVIGTTSKDSAMNAGLAAKADAFVDVWERWQHVKPRVYRDTEITPDVARRYSLLLLGGATANAVSARLAPQLPIAVTPAAITIGGRKFAARDAVAQLIYPHPENSQRYVLLVEATSPAGLRYWNPQQFWHALNGFPMNFWDWTIVDGRHVTQSPGLLPDRGWIAAGIFDRHWRRDDTFTVPGDAVLRARAHLRAPPPPGFKLPGAALDALTGRYQIDAGQIGGGGLINVVRAGDTISASAPEGGRAFTLEAETGDDFAIFGLGTPVTFRRDGAGAVTGLQYHYNGQEIVATRLGGS
ncbi:MAG: prolyl oligopeptidase family serine peptidase [Pseudomonadota bacterium]